MRKAVFCVCTVVEHGDGDVQLFVCVRVCVCVCVSLYSAVWISATPAPRVATVPASAPTSSIPPRPFPPPPPQNEPPLVPTVPPLADSVGSSPEGDVAVFAAACSTLRAALAPALFG